MNARLKTATTLAGLTVLLLLGVTWGFAQVTDPFPGKVDPPVCVDQSFAEGDELFVQEVTVSVLNASKREGLAGRTLQLFTEQGFAEGQTANAPKGTDVAEAEIWVEDPENPAVRLVRSRLGKVEVVGTPDNPAVGVTVVVGDAFEDLRNGPDSVVLKADAVICSPPVN